MNRALLYTIAAGVLLSSLPMPSLRAQDKQEDSGDWSASVKFPEQEKPIKLFNGKDLEGWEGHAEKYFSVKDGLIVAKNSKENAPPVSTYLLTKKDYKNFRLVFEGKLVESEMHSGIAIWGKKFEKDGEKFSYQGHLVMFPTHWGFWDLYRRNSIYQDDGRARKADNKGWNKMEILAQPPRIRLAVNGELVADWKDPKPELCEAGPIGLQLHSNSVPQEVHFRGLILSADPQDEMITVKTAEKLSPGKQALQLYDQNKDSKLSEKELTAGLLAARKRFDRNGDGDVTADEIDARMQDYHDSRVGLTQLSLLVSLDGMPLEGAEVKLVPEAWIADWTNRGGGRIAVAQGITNNKGRASLALDKKDLTPDEQDPVPLQGVRLGVYRVEIRHPKGVLPKSYGDESKFSVEVCHDDAEIYRLHFALQSR